MKYEDLKSTPHEKHFIGHLQTNKIKEVLKYVQCIQSVDRLELAEKLEKRLQFEERSIDILIQVNIPFEESKFGILPENAVSFAKELANFQHLNIKGLMTIGLFSEEDEKVRKCFKLLKNIQQEIKVLEIPNIKMDVLSMGMDNDLEVAIEEFRGLLIKRFPFRKKKEFFYKNLLSFYFA